MPRTPKLPDGVAIYSDKGGSGDIYRVRLGKRFLGPHGVPRKRAFTKLSDAYDWIKEENEKLYGKPRPEGAGDLTDDQLADSRFAFQRLAKYPGTTLTDAVDCWLRVEAPLADSVEIGSAIKALLAEQKSQELSDRHQNDTRKRLNRMFKGLEKRRISSLTRAEMEKVRDAKDGFDRPPSPELKVKRIRYASLFFSWAIEKGYLLEGANPLRGVTKPRLRAKKVPRLSPKEVAKLLITCQEIVPEFIPSLVLKFFSGVRNEELYFLTWDAIKDSSVRIEKTKTDRARSMPLPDALKAWLPKQADRPDKATLLFSINPDRKDREDAFLDLMKTIREKAKVKIPQNALRHTFGTYRCGQCGDPALVAFEMGNSAAVARRHYVDAVEPEDMELYWSLAPTVCKEIVEGSYENPSSKPPPPRTRDVEDPWENP